MATTPDPLFSSVVWEHYPPFLRDSISSETFLLTTTTRLFRERIEIKTRGRTSYLRAILNPADTALAAILPAATGSALFCPATRMPETDITRDLREAGSEFIESHQRAEAAIREAVSVGMPADAIAHVSGLSRPTVDAFLGQLVATPKPEN
jgi:hypothetical protein